MSSRPFLKPFKAIENGDMSADITSIPTILTNLSMVSYQISWTGATPVGSVIVEASNDYSLDASGKVLNAGTWSEITQTLASITGNSGKGMININSIPAYAIRIKYTFVSGTGTLNATIVAKVM
jgi:hypothetical protein